MIVSAGKDFRVIVRIDGVEYPIHGERTSTGSVTSEFVDVTNKGNVAWRHGLPVGVRNTTIKVSGITFDIGGDKALLTALRIAAFNGQSLFFSIQTGNGDTWIPAMYRIVSMEVSGNHNGVDEWSMALSRSGMASPPSVTLSVASVIGHTVVLSGTISASGTWSSTLSFGDGLSELNPVLPITHFYVDGSIYTATLTVVQSDGQTATATVQVDTSQIDFLNGFNASSDQLSLTLSVTPIFLPRLVLGFDRVAI